MAGGIFTAVSLQHIPRGPLLTTPLAAALGLSWLVIAWLVSREAVRDGLRRHTGPLVGSFAIGTWVAASAIVVRMAMLAAPDARWLAEALFTATVGLWLWFAPQPNRPTGPSPAKNWRVRQKSRDIMAVTSRLAAAPSQRR